MVSSPRPGHDGAMNVDETRTAPPDGDFDPHRLRSITQMKRSQDDRLLGGVCAGAAKYLNIDPVVVRVVIAVLTLVGFAGVIVYVAAWFLLPAEGEDRSIAAEWFRLDKNEEQVRVAGLVGAAAIALLAVFGDGDWFWGGAPWILVPLGGLYYLFVVRPRRRRASEVAGPPVAAAGPLPHQPPARPRRERSWALTWLTLSIAAIAVASVRIYSEYHDRAPWTAYVAVALAVVALGLLAGAFFGNGGPLIAAGVLLAVALAVGSLVPSGRLGEQRQTPSVTGEVHSTYTHGIGLLELDLTQIRSDDPLTGRTIKIRAGVGQTRVVVPRDLEVAVRAHLAAGEISVFGRSVNGTDQDLDTPQATGPALTIDIDQRLGNIEVIRQ
jgi:phage shock protein PspC (stress-responsive transcriptional regulator)